MNTTPKGTDSPSTKAKFTLEDGDDDYDDDDDDDDYDGDELKPFPTKLAPVNAKPE
jgi:hypothetical protein